MSKPLVLFTAPVGTRSGYGAHSRDIARSLIAMDRFDIKIFPVRWGSTPQNALNEKDPNDIEIIKNAPELAPYTVGICTSKRILSSPIVSAFWESV